MKINGVDFPLKETQTLNTLTLKTLLQEQGYNPDHVAVEINGEIIPKSAYEETLLSDDDVIEVVRFVGGG